MNHTHTEKQIKKEVKIKETNIQIQNKQIETTTLNKCIRTFFSGTSSVTVPIDLRAKLSLSHATGGPHLSFSKLFEEDKTLRFLCIQSHNPTNLVETISSCYSVSNSSKLPS
jgi:hypothetical protein